MSCNSDNDLEDLLEKSIDEKYSKITDYDKKPNKCPFNFKNRSKFSNKINRSINQVEEKVKFNSLLLPEGWVRLFHESGMFFYCHVSTKVVTWSMPYQLQTEPPRYHRVPVRSIPCLSFKFMKTDVDNIDLLKDNNKNNQTEIEKIVAVNPIELMNNDNKPINIDVNEEKIDINNTIDDINSIKLEQKDIEDGEIESSDDECDNYKYNDKEFFLPKQYQIDTVNHKPNRLKLNSISESTRSTDPSNIPLKRRKITSSEDDKIVETVSTVVLESNNPCQTSETNHEITSTESEDLSAKLLEPVQLRTYCNKLFTFVEETKYVPRFFFVKRKLKKSESSNTTTNPPIPTKSGETNTALAITNSIIETTVSMTCTEKLKIPNKNIFLDLAGRNFSCILNMYCQNAFGVTPTFKTSSSLSGIHDFEVSCDISGTAYAIGEGRTKKIAKQKAVVKTLEILIPGFLNMVSGGNGSGNVNDKTLSSIDSLISASTSQTNTSGDRGDCEIYSIFDNMDITDPRVLSYTTKLNSMSPHSMLIECMNRHCVLESHLISSICKQNKHNVFKLKLGDKEVQANCENKREGRQLASQYMLAKLHPHIQRWGGILRLYGPDSKPVKRFDMHEMQNLLLEDRGGVKSNLINLLRKKMLELNDEWQSTSKSFAKFKVPFENIPIIVFHPDSSNNQSK